MRNTGLRLALSAGFLAAILPAASSAQDSSEKQIIEAKVRYCKDCHGRQAQGFPGANPVPRLAGQPLAYLQARAEIISGHKRDNPTADTFMGPAMASMKPESRTAVFEHFTTLNPPPAAPGPKNLAAAGKKIYDGGDPQAGVPACASCHGPDGKGSGPVPRVAGQIYPYAVKVLTKWATINREHEKNGTTEVKSAREHTLPPQQIDQVASYISNMK